MKWGILFDLNIPAVPEKTGHHFIEQVLRHHIIGLSVILSTVLKTKVTIDHFKIMRVDKESPLFTSNETEPPQKGDGAEK